MCVSGEWSIVKAIMTTLPIWSEARQESNHDHYSLRHPANLKGSQSQSCWTVAVMRWKERLCPSLVVLEEIDLQYVWCIERVFRTKKITAHKKRFWLMRGLLYVRVSPPLGNLLVKLCRWPRDGGMQWIIQPEETKNTTFPVCTQWIILYMRCLRLRDGPKEDTKREQEMQREECDMFWVNKMETERIKKKVI